MCTFPTEAHTEATSQASRASLDVIAKTEGRPLGEQRNLMWAFPSFGCFLQDPAQPPLDMPPLQVCVMCVCVCV
jgi:hypothetical protein